MKTISTLEPIAASSLKIHEVLGALSYALDMTEGQPEGHCIRVCYIGYKIGQALEFTEHQLWELYYTLLLKDLGCSSNAARICELYLTDDLNFKRKFKEIDTGLSSVLGFIISHTGLKAGLSERFRALFNIIQNGHKIGNELIETRCNRGADIARKLRFGEDVARGIHDLDEHWDGKGQPNGLSGKEISPYARIALLSQVIDVFHKANGREAAIAEAKKRAGTWFDEEYVEAFLNVSFNPKFFDELENENIEEIVFNFAPANDDFEIDEDFLDDIASAFGQVVDSKSPYTSGHSARVALYTDMIAESMGLNEAQRRWLKRGALLHDVGKLGVSNSILDKAGKLDENEWEQMKLHALYTENILSRINAFKELAKVAGAHHERLDGKGYPHGLSSEEITLETRIISIADFFDALTADRPYRAALSIEKALEIIGESVGPAIDKECFEALKRAVDLIENQTQ